MQLSALSSEYVRVRVDATDSGIRVNPTGDVVALAFPVSGVAPISGDWKTAAWETDATQTPSIYYARYIPALSAGSYDVWIKITDSPEVPVRKAGTLTVI